MFGRCVRSDVSGPRHPGSTEQGGRAPAASPCRTFAQPGNPFSEVVGEAGGAHEPKILQNRGFMPQTQRQIFLHQL